MFSKSRGLLFSGRNVTRISHPFVNSTLNNATSSFSFRFYNSAEDKLQQQLNESLQRKISISPIQIIPQGEVWIKEQFGKFDEVLYPGLRFLIPWVHQISMRFPTKEIAHTIGYQTAITKDNVQLRIDGVVFYRIVDPVKAAYEITNPYAAIIQLAQTTMRAEIGKIELDKTFSERQLLNTQIVQELQKTAEGWGIQVNRYEIMNIDVPQKIKDSMELEAEAERNKRKKILESVADKQSAENVALGEKIARILHAEAEKTEQEKIAEAEAYAIRFKAEATAEAIKTVAKALEDAKGSESVNYHLARDYINAFSKIAKNSNTVIVPANVNDASAMIGQAMGVFGGVYKGQKLEQNELNDLKNPLQFLHNSPEVKKDTENKKI